MIPSRSPIHRLVQQLVLNTDQIKAAANQDLHTTPDFAILVANQVALATQLRDLIPPRARAAADSQLSTSRPWDL